MTWRTLPLLTAAALLISIAACTDNTEASGTGSGGGTVKVTIVGEVENIGPGITRKLVVQAAPGTFEVACKPGMVGDGNRAKFVVTDS